MSDSLIGSKVLLRFAHKKFLIQPGVWHFSGVSHPCFGEDVKPSVLSIMNIYGNRYIRKYVDK